VRPLGLNLYDLLARYKTMTLYHIKAGNVMFGFGIA
jgi:hypothetical protein